MTNPMNGSTSSNRPKSRRGILNANEKEVGQERWLLTYADMITLLLVLFIVLFALSAINPAKYREFRQSVTHAVNSQVPHGTTAVPTKSKAPETNQLSKIEQKLRAALGAQGLLGDVTLTVNSSGLVEGLVSDATFFGTNSADLSPIGAKIIDTSASAIRQYQNAIEVAGYTDNEPVIGGQYPNNWALSAARATTVVVRMTKADGVDPSRVALIGYGQYHPLVSNDTPAGQAQNRRVNIVISPTANFKP